MQLHTVYPLQSCKFNNIQHNLQSMHPATNNIHSNPKLLVLRLSRRHQLHPTQPTVDRYSLMTGVPTPKENRRSIQSIHNDELDSGSMVESLISLFSLGCLAKVGGYESYDICISVAISLQPSLMQGKLSSQIRGAFLSLCRVNWKLVLFVGIGLVTCFNGVCFLLSYILDVH